MLIFNEAITHLQISYGKPMTVIKFLVFIITRGSIKTVFKTYYPITSTRSVPSFKPDIDRVVIIHGMSRVRIIRR